MEADPLDAALNFTITSGKASLAVVPSGARLIGPSTKSIMRSGSVFVVAGVEASKAFLDFPIAVLPAV